MIFYSDEQLSAFVPNNMVAAHGEHSLLEKIAPELERAEAWVRSTFYDFPSCNASGYDDFTFNIAARVVALEAMRASFPALNLVLTPNGAAVVSNNNLTPASKERSQSLLDNLEERRDIAINDLLRHLRVKPDWVASPLSEPWRATLFHDLEISRHFLGDKNISYHRALQRIEQVKGVEASLADDFISWPVMKALRLSSISGNASLDITESNLIATIRSQSLEVLRGGAISTSRMLSLVNEIRSSCKFYSMWKHSDTGRAYRNHRFQNRRDDSGYFF